MARPGPRPHGAEDDTARRILDAALEQFTLLGVRRSSVDDVAKRAGVSRVTVYRRFQTKDRLVEETLLRELSRFFARLDAAVAGLPTMRERVIEGFVVALRHTRAHPVRRHAAARTRGSAAVPDRAGRLLARGHRRVPDGASAPGAAGRGRPDEDPRPVAELMVRVAVSFLLNPSSCIEMEDAEQARNFARRYLAPLLDA